jgi:hypothetical protein
MRRHHINHQYLLTKSKKKNLVVRKLTKCPFAYKGKKSRK